MRSPLPLVAGSLLLGTTLSVPARAHVFIAVALVAVAIGSFAARARRSFAGLALIVAAFFTGASLRSVERAAAPRARATQHAREVDGTLERPCRARGERTTCLVVEPDATRIALSFEEDACDARAGDRVRALATLVPVQPTVNDGALGPGGALFADRVTLRGESAACDVTRALPTPVALVRRVGDALRRALDQGISKAFDTTSAARARALLFGDDDAIEPDAVQAFRTTGLSHLLAVSGAHVALVAAALAWIARTLAARVASIAERGWVPRIEALLSLPAVLVFVCATGEAPSAVRALVMASLALVAKLGARSSDGPALLAASAVVTLGVVPSWRGDVGWQLSIAASWALVSAHRDAHARSDREDPRRIVRAIASLVGWLGSALSATLRVALLTAPIVASMSGRLPLSGLLANLVAAPIGEVVSLPLVLVAALTGALYAPLGALVAVPAKWSLAALFAIPSMASRWPLASIECWPPTRLQQIVWLAIVGLALLAKSRRTLALSLLLALAAVASIELVHRRDAQPTGILRVTMIDVGQGDAILVDLPDGEAMLVDGGGVIVGPDPGERVVVPALALRRRRRLAVVVASHPHPDHVNGLRAVLRWASARELWDTRQSEQWSGGARWLEERSLAAQKGTLVRGPESLCGPPRYFHGAILEVLAPCRGIREETSPNDASFVLRLSFGASSVLLPGDLERDGERALLEARAIAPVTVLKLGHHGSRTSSTLPWLHALAPRLALSSAGHPSPFQHPHRSVVQRLESLHIPLLSTSERGMIVVDLSRDGRVRARDESALRCGACGEFGLQPLAQESIR
ncbi:MAG: DNA internalization-related competence protein ComEC/Rec2 [Myxococcales bacterium]|nr:DNA internalization-related competence protein ComEC/Rec2 [Myxococcales bacterium]